jgi:hypothetical protein
VTGAAATLSDGRGNGFHIDGGCCGG